MLPLSILFCALVTGCATTEYYTRPDSPGYQENHFSAICELCGRQFLFSKALQDSSPQAPCPYDGYVQDLQYANNRYVYAQQEANRNMAVQMLNVWQQGQTRLAQKQAEYLRCYNDCMIQRGIGSSSAPFECFNACQ